MKLKNIRENVVEVEKGSMRVMPEAVEQYTEKSADLIVRAEELRIATPADLEVAAGFGKLIRDLKKEVADYWNNPETGPTALAHKAWKASVVKRDEMLNPLVKADTTVSRLITSYNDEQDRLIAERQRELEREAADRRQAEIDAQKQLAEERGATKKAVKQMERQMKAEPVFVPPVTAPAKPKGLSVPKKWKARLTNLGSLLSAMLQKPELRAMVKFDQAKANQYATSTQGIAKVPGVEFYQDSHTRY